MARSMTTRSSAGFGCSRSALANDGGFTLAEVVVAIALFMIMATTATYGLIKTMQVTNITKDRVAAANVAAQELERLRSQNFTPFLLDSTPRTVTLRGMTFTVTPVLSVSPTGDCPTGAFRNVSVVVSWNSNPPRTARYDSVLAC